MEQGQSAAQIFVNNGIGGAGDGIPIAQPPGQSPGEGGFPRTQIPPVGNDRPSGQPLSQCRPNSTPIFRQRANLTGDGSALLELFYGIGERGIGHMDIAIHGGFDARMTEQPLQDFRHDPAFNCASGIGVP